jgi:hypothetical protein
MVPSKTLVTVSEASFIITSYTYRPAFKFAVDAELKVNEITPFIGVGIATKKSAELFAE